MHTEARYPVREKNFLGGISGLVSGLWCLFENGNSKKFSQYCFVKTQFWQTKLGFLQFSLEFFLDFCQKWVFEFKCGFSWNKKPIFHLVRVSRESGILGLKMKTHVLKISPGSRAHGSASGEVKSHKDFQRWKTQNMKMGFWPCLVSIPSFPKLSLVLQSDE